jgi:hypothetical protein
MTSDPKAIDAEEKKENNRANLQSDLQDLIAINGDSQILYPGADAPIGRIAKEKELPIITEENFQTPAPGGLIQREPDVGTRIQKPIETVEDTVK